MPAQILDLSDKLVLKKIRDCGIKNGNGSKADWDNLVREHPQYIARLVQEYNKIRQCIDRVKT